MLPSILGRRAQTNAQQIRCYVMSVSPGRKYASKKMPRTFSVRKNYLLNQYTRLLDGGNSLLFVSHKNFSAGQMIKLRRDVAGVKATTATGTSASAGLLERPDFLVIRTGIFGVALREHSGYSILDKRRLARLVTSGGVGVVRMPSLLDPGQIAGVLRVLERAGPPAQRAQAEDNEETAATDAAARLAMMIDNPTPGRRPKRVRPQLKPELTLKAGLVEGRVFVVDEVKRVSRLPGMQELLGQIVGLIGSGGVAGELVQVLSEAGGGDVLRTLEGFRKGLETREA